MTYGILSAWGVVGSVFSRGLDPVAEHFQPNSSFFYNGEFEGLDEQADKLIEQGFSGPIIMMGHSKGATAAIDQARRLVKAGLNVAGIFTLDPHLRRSQVNGAGFHLNIYQTKPIFAFKRFYAVSRNAAASGTLINIKRSDTTHVALDDEPDVQERFITEISRILNSENTEKEEPNMKPFYIGEGRQLDEQGIVRLATKYGIPPYLALAATHIESANLQGSWSSGALVTLWEDHVTYRNTSGATRQKLVDERLAARGWRDLPYPKSPYPSIDRVAVIAGEEVAAKSCSWGLYQILGENHDHLGFDTALEMVRWMAEGEDNQFIGWIRFIESVGVKDDLLREDWHGYSRRYNGSRYAEHDYHGRLSRQASKWAAKYGKGFPSLPPVTDPVLPPPTDPLPTPDPGQGLTLEQFRQIPTEQLSALQQNMGDALKLIAIVRDERLQQPQGTSAAFPSQTGKGTQTMNNTQPKAAWQSSGVLGSILAILAVGDQILGTNISGNPEVNQVVTGIGALLALFGRIKATSTINRVL